MLDPFPARDGLKKTRDRHSMLHAKPFIVALSAAGLSLAALPAMSQNVHISRLYEQVLENIEYTKPGFFLDSFGVVRLNEGATTRIELDVPTNTAIEIMGDCDEDCTDLDLGIYNAAGKLLGEDRYDDYYPIVSFVSEDDGRLALELDLVDCDAAYCYTAYSVFVEGTE
ncbi:hypothetical protein V6617_09780 [Pelagibacterium nitratireducens]|uniref:Uncharacterized protein n=1 Tax=Pelagibacterium nitratireducens TaxID=1046114 RepID=A0ABZ2HZ84_9HYPH